MTGTTITLLALEDSIGELRSRWAAAADHWPGLFHAPKPSVVEVTIGDALSNPHRLPGEVAIIACAPSHERRACILKLVDLLDARMTPTVLLAPTAEDAYSGLTSGRVLLLAPDTKPEALASAIGALLARQPAITALMDELKTLRRFQGGLSDEIDRLHEELQLAAHVQRQFIPRSLPEVPGLDFGVLFRPCGYVSGDIYDIARVSPDRIGFFVADAVGHGVPAALMTMVLSKAMPSLDDDGQFVGPAESLCRLNTALMKRTGNVQTFATAVCGVINPRTGEVILAGAGHPPPLRMSHDGLEPVETEGSLLGVFEDGEFNEVGFTLRRDEILLLHSDGFETAFPETDGGRSRNSASMRYLDHFRRILDDRDRAGLAAAMSNLIQSLDEQAGSLHQVDDETALVVARAGTSVRQAA